MAGKKLPQIEIFPILISPKIYKDRYSKKEYYTLDREILIPYWTLWIALRPWIVQILDLSHYLSQLESPEFPSILWHFDFTGFLKKLH